MHHSQATTAIVAGVWLYFFLIYSYIIAYYDISLSYRCECF